MLISVKLLAKYVTDRYYNLCLRFGTWKVRRLNQSRKVVPPSKFPAVLGGKNSCAVVN